MTSERIVPLNGTPVKPKVDPLTIDGWMTEEELAWLTEQAQSSETIVEIGSWKGRSTTALLNGCPGTVHAIDHFKGSPGEDRHSEAREHDVFAEFMANVGAYPNLAIHRADSVTPAQLFADRSVDMVFIDGGHDKEQVLRDLRAWMPKCKTLLCGHDRDWIGVQEALAEMGIKWSQGPGVLWFAPVDGVSTVPKMTRKGICISIVSGRGYAPIAMIPAIVMQGYPTNTNVQVLTLLGKDVDAGRTIAIEQAIEQKNKYAWFVDDDTVPPQDAARHLIYILEQHPKAMVAGGIYCTRSTPPEPIVYMEQGAGCYWDWKVGDVFKCWGIGTGCMMINLDIFKHIEKPWFLTRNDAEFRGTDDLHFCELVNKAGFEVWAHGGLLCHHYDIERGAVYMLPRGSRPYVNRSLDFRESKL